MAQQHNGFEPALAWSAVFVIGAPAVLISGLIAGGAPGRELIGKALLACGAAYSSLFLAVIGSMMEPLPRDPGAAPPGLRLRASWAVLGLCPPPSRRFRLAAAAALCALLFYPIGELRGWGVVAAGLLLAFSGFLGKPKDILQIDLLESGFLLGTAAAAVAALYFCHDASPAAAVRAAAALAAVTLLHAQRTREICAARWVRVLPGVKPPPALDLSRYELSVERKGPAERAALPEGVEAQLVDTGSFRVDAAKMLDKLRDYQLTDPNDFVCAWLRCAAASGASAIRLTPHPTGLELAFDGRPFTAAQLSQPYQSLVGDDSPDGRRNRHFAYGLLGLYRLRPRSVSVTSRGEGGVAAMNAGAGKPPDPEKAPQGTVLRVTWPLWAFYWRPAVLAMRAKQRYGLGPASLTVDGEAVLGRPEADSWRPLELNGWRGAYRPRYTSSRVRLYVLGTLIEETEGEAPFPVDAWLAHDDLELNISQTAVVRDRLLKAGFALLGTLVRPT
ncbi:hypothetical protein EPO15_08925 [bacterium]|nr:MAG: hypothetical protein EPO15_08925 [bacterium]